MAACCTICDGLFTSGDPTQTNSTSMAPQCGHVFHYTCLQGWLDRDSKCPRCRVKIDLKKIVKLYFSSYGDLSGDRGYSNDGTVQKLKYELKMRELELMEAQKELNKAKTQTDSLWMQLVKKENEVKMHAQAVAKFQEKIARFQKEEDAKLGTRKRIAKPTGFLGHFKAFKSQLKGPSEMELRVAELEKQLEYYKSLEIASLKNSAAEAFDAPPVVYVEEVTDSKISSLEGSDSEAFDEQYHYRFISEPVYYRARKLLPKRSQLYRDVLKWPLYIICFIFFVIVTDYLF